MNRRIVAAGALLLAFGASACGNNSGSPVGYVPEGQAGNSVLISNVEPDTRLTVVFTDTLTNAGDSLDTFELTGVPNDFPAGTTFGVFKSDGVAPFTDTNKNGLADTGPVDPGAIVLVVLHATLPGGSAGGPYTAALTATSVLDSHRAATATNVLGEVYPAVRADQTDSALPGPLGAALSQAAVAPGPGSGGTLGLQSAVSSVGPVRVDANPAVKFAGQTIAQAWPTFSDRLLVTGLIVDHSAANGFRIYSNPGGQGFRPAEDFIAVPTNSWPTGWNFYSIRLASFDPSVGTDLVGRGAYHGLESGAAPVTEHSYLPIATPAELVHRLDVSLISPADSAQTDSLPELAWNPAPGASRYLVQIIGHNGLQYLALTTATTHKVQDPSAAIYQTLPMRDRLFYQWGVIAVTSENRIIGFSHETRSIEVRTK